MNKPSERIVVFVSPAQKRAITATADGLGISISELMRRAVIAFSATEEQVKAASIVDRLNAPRQPDALAQVLRRAAKPQHERPVSPLLSAHPEAPSHDDDAPALVPLETEDADRRDEIGDEAALMAHALPTPPDDAETRRAAPRPTVLPTVLPTAPTAGQSLGNAARKIAQAVARLSERAGPADTAFAESANVQDDEPLRPLSARPLPYASTSAQDDDSRDDAPEGGKFA